jgi:hypothetical protein
MTNLMDAIRVATPEFTKSPTCQPFAGGPNILYFPLELACLRDPMSMITVPPIGTDLFRARSVVSGKGIVRGAIASGFDFPPLGQFIPIVKVDTFEDTSQISIPPTSAPSVVIGDFVRLQVVNDDLQVEDLQITGKIADVRKTSRTFSDPGHVVDSYLIDLGSPLFGFAGARVLLNSTGQLLGMLFNCHQSNLALVYPIDLF